MNFDIDIAIVIGFLVLNLSVGLYYGRGVRSIKDYALGGRNFSTSALVATIVATWMSGSFFSISIIETYKGSLGFILGVAYVLNLLITSLVFAPRVKIFYGKLSVAEVMGELYGKNVRVIAGISSMFSTISLLALQIKVFSTMFSSFMSVDSVFATYMCTFIIVLYSAFGGIKSVTFTDVIQLITFGVLIPILTLILWKSFGGYEQISNVLETNPSFSLSNIFDYTSNSFWVTLVLFVYYMIPSLNPVFFQRALIAKDVFQAKKSFAIASLICFLIFSLSCLIGLMTLASSYSLETNNIAFVATIFSYPIMKSFLIISIIAMVMSTADSWLNAGSIIFSHDICNPLGFKGKELIASRLFTVVIGIGSIILALHTDSLLDIVLIGANFYMPIVTVPLMLGLFGFRTSAKVIINSMILSVLVVVIWKSQVQLHTGIDSVISGLITSLLSVFMLHYLSGSQGGWVDIKDNSYIEEQKLTRRRRWNKFVEGIYNFNFITFCKNHIPKQDSVYIYFAGFCMIVTYATMFLTPSFELLQDQILMFSYISVLLVSISFIIVATFFLEVKKKNSLQYCGC